MTDPGNHECDQRFAHYTERFRNLPHGLATSFLETVTTDNGQSPNNWFYAVDVGNVHLLSISTEVYFSNPELVPLQLAFIEADLGSVDRSKTPWVIVHGHRPFYCSTDSDCDGPAMTLKSSLEEVFHSYGVDLYLCGHEHNYERMHAIYKEVMDSSAGGANPRATTYIVTGDAGNVSPTPQPHTTLTPNPKTNANHKL